MNRHKLKLVIPPLEDLNIVVAFLAVGTYYLVHGLLTGKWITGFGVLEGVIIYIGIGRMTRKLKR